MESSDNEKHAPVPTTSTSLERAKGYHFYRLRVSKWKLICILFVMVFLCTSVLIGWQVWGKPHQLVVNEFDVPPDWGKSANTLEQIVLGPDGNLWFVSSNGQWMGQMTPKGGFRQFFTGSSEVPLWSALAWGTDGNLWANAYNQRGLVQFNPQTETFKMYPYFFDDLAVANESSLWLKMEKTHSIGHLDLHTGIIQQYRAPQIVGTFGCCIQGMVAEDDGIVWFTTGDNDALFLTNPQKTKITQNAGVARFDLKTSTFAAFSIPDSILSSYSMLTLAKDGGVWLLCSSVDAGNLVHYLVHVSSTGMVKIYTAPNGGDVYNFTQDPKGNLWLIYQEAYAKGAFLLARLTEGVIKAVGRIPDKEPRFMTYGPNHSLWITAGRSIEQVNISSWE